MRKKLLLGSCLLAGVSAVALLLHGIERLWDASDRAH